MEEQQNIWKTSPDGLLQYVQVTNTLLQESLDVIRKSFYVGENVCVALGMPDHPECFQETDSLIEYAAKDGVSIAAIDTKTGRIAGVAINKLHEAGTPDFCLEKLKSFQHSPSRHMVEWMLEVADSIDIFEYSKGQTGLEVMFLGVLPEYRKRGIAKTLFEVTIDLAKTIKSGKDIRKALDGGALSVFRPLDFVTAICTSFVTQKIVRDLGFECVLELNFDKFVYGGISLSGQINDGTKVITYDYLKL